MYDLYLLKGVNTSSALQGLEQLIPKLKDPAFQQRLMSRPPHFLGLELDARKAVNLLRRLRAERALGYILPSAYRQPRITRDQAAQVAEQAIREQHGHEVLEPAHFEREEAVSWVFGAMTQEKQKKVYLHIDKLDGHVWDKKDLELLWNESYFLGAIGREGKSPYIIPTEGSDQKQEYDLFLAKGAYTLPALDDLVQLAPVLGDPAVRDQLVQQSPSPGLLKLALAKDVVLECFSRLKENGSEGYIVPVSYRNADITIDQATLLAEQRLEEVKAVRSGDTLGPIRCMREEPVYWIFGAHSEQLAREDRIPAMVFIMVDKLDGHIWKEKELKRLWEDT